MKVTIIYGTTSKARTYNCVQLLLNKLSFNTNIKVTEFFLPQDSSHFYCGCFSCLINGNERHLHFGYADSIVKSLYKSDLIILASPVFTCDISTQMKSVLDYLYYECSQNKTKHSMHNKIGLVMSTTAGAGLFHTTRTLKKSLNFLGVNNTFKFSKTLYEMNWEEITLKTKTKINKKISKISNKILDLYNKSHTVNIPTFSKVTSSKIKPMFNYNNCNVIDFNYWKEHACFHSKNIQ